jgi:multiple sugar transport system substrate-binding protein
VVIDQEHGQAHRAISRRRFLRGAAGLTAASTVAGPLAACQPPEPTGGNGGGGGKVALDFVIWSYSVETVQDNIDRFQRKFPSISVDLSDISWNVYHQSMVNRFTSKTPMDVTYNGGDWLPEFASAGWVVPLQDHLPWVMEYEDKIFDFAWQDMVADGKLYGMPYYADTISFLYNDQLLKEAGISAPPQSWEEVTEQSKRLQSRGMERPVLIELAQDLPTITEVFVSMVFGRGGELIDEQSNPQWTDSSSAAAQQFQWLVDAANKDKILTYVPHETVVVREMNTGKYAFTVLYNYNLASLNNKATSPRAGQFRLGQMPGETQECYGFAKFYNMTKMAVDRGDEVVDACGRFIEYSSGKVAGDYHVAKRWALQSGLGFGQKPLFDDPQVRKALSKWMDLDTRLRQLELARAQRHTVWYGIWSDSFRREYVKAMSGEASAEQALEASAQEWSDLKEKYEG